MGHGMASDLEIWARAERGFISEEIKYLRAGGKIISPSGDDITAAKLDQLDKRLEGVNLALERLTNAPGT